ncbi:MAG TPA: hypothetical protein VHQ92_10990 [Pseudolabrys sp.]|jgi:transcriptional regulator NrdR family protein|nr:hypothetical protein [Pseudolabrys sp.]
MNCPDCGAPNNGVTDTRQRADSTKRRRKCEACGFAWTTLESLHYVGRPGIHTEAARREELMSHFTAAELLAMAQQKLKEDEATE